jgi:hypothetical protein
VSTTPSLYATECSIVTGLAVHRKNICLLLGCTAKNKAVVIYGAIRLFYYTMTPFVDIFYGGFFTVQLGGACHNFNS